MPATPHIADLHAEASRLAIEGYRKLAKEELEQEIEAAGGDAVTAVDAGAGTPLAGNGGAAAEVDARGRLTGDEPTEEVSGVLDILPQRYGFLRLTGLESDPGDVYVSASQVRRCELRTGDQVAGPAREPRRGERHRALVHVDQVNGAGPLASERPEFGDLAPVAPERRIPLDGDVLTRAVDLLSPLALGQRVLVRAAPRSGRTTLLRGIARGLAGVDGVELTVLLVDERPEEATAWRQAVEGARFAIATSDMDPADQLRLCDLALASAMRRAEAGGDAVLLVDSLSRLGFAAGDVAAVKRLFGAGRNLDGGGSLTVIATTLVGAEDEGAAERAVATTENAVVTLAPGLAALGVAPALVAAECRVSNEETLRDGGELEGARKLRERLAGLDNRAAADFLRERIEASASNAELLEKL